MLTPNTTETAGSNIIEKSLMTLDLRILMRTSLSDVEQSWNATAVNVTYVYLFYVKIWNHQDVININ